MFTIVVEIPRSALQSSHPHYLSLCFVSTFSSDLLFAWIQITLSGFPQFSLRQDPIALGRWDKRQADKFHFALFFTVPPSS